MAINESIRLCCSVVGLALAAAKYEGIYAIVEIVIAIEHELVLSLLK